MDECTIVELHRLRIMRLTTTDDRCARISHQTKILHLLRVWVVIVTFIPLESRDDYIAFSFELIDLLREEVLHGGGFDRPLSWWKLQIDADRCSACAVCARICPTGAIVEESYPDRQLIGLEVMRCTNCGLCIEACPDEAIKFGEPVYIGDCLDGKWNQLVKNRLSPCSVCGDPVTPASSGRCPTCDRRQISLLC